MHQQYNQIQTSQKPKDSQRHSQGTVELTIDGVDLPGVGCQANRMIVFVHVATQTKESHAWHHLQAIHDIKPLNDGRDKLQLTVYVRATVIQQTRDIYQRK